MQDADAHDDVPGAGNGYVDIFATDGHLVQRLVSSGALNSPWGLALAPVGFGGFAGDLLVGNFGDGRINAFNPTNGAWLGTVYGTNGNPFLVEGLWGLAFGNGGNGGEAHTLYFTAGIPGPDSVESHGLFGSLAAVFPTITSITTTNHGANVTLNWAGGAGPFEVLMNSNVVQSTWANALTTTNHTATVPGGGSTTYFHLLNQGN